MSQRRNLRDVFVNTKMIKLGQDFLLGLKELVAKSRIDWMRRVKRSKTQVARERKERAKERRQMIAEERKEGLIVRTDSRGDAYYYLRRRGLRGKMVEVYLGPIEAFK